MKRIQGLTIQDVQAMGIEGFTRILCRKCRRKEIDEAKRKRAEYCIRMHNRGLSEVTIAEYLDISPMTVHRAIKDNKNWSVNVI